MFSSGKGIDPIEVFVIDLNAVKGCTGNISPVKINFSVIDNGVVNRTERLLTKNVTSGLNQQG